MNGARRENPAQSSPLGKRHSREHLLSTFIHHRQSSTLDLFHQHHLLPKSIHHHRPPPLSIEVEASILPSSAATLVSLDVGYTSLPSHPTRRRSWPERTLCSPHILFTTRSPRLAQFAPPQLAASSSIVARLEAWLARCFVLSSTRRVHPATATTNQSMSQSLANLVHLLVFHPALMRR